MSRYVPLWWKICCAWGLATVCGISNVAATELGNSYSIGIAPQQATSELAKRWVPLIKYWSDATGVSFQFRTSKDIGTFQEDVRKGAYDVMFVNAYHYTHFNRDPGYVAFASEKGASNHGILVVLHTSPVYRVEQLDLAKIAFSSPSAVMGTWLTGAYLRESKVRFSPVYVKSMDSVYRSVAKGLFSAGGGEMRTYGALDPEIKSQLRIVWQSEAFPSHPFSAHPRVPADIVKRLQRAMIETDRSPLGAELLRAVNIGHLSAANDADYDRVRKMDLKPVEGG